MSLVDTHARASILVITGIRIDFFVIPTLSLIVLISLILFRFPY